MSNKKKRKKRTAMSIIFLYLCPIFFCRSTKIVSNEIRGEKENGSSAKCHIAKKKKIYTYENM
jgi:hypothetical protein